MKKVAAALLVVLVSIVTSGPASAAPGCPKIESLIDFNCDKKLKIVFLGDSITFGIGDSKRPVQGYPGRIQKALPTAEVINLGVPGITSAGLMANVKQALTKKPANAMGRALHDADFILVSVGVNDFFSGVEDAGRTLRNIAAILKYLKTTLKDSDGTAPIIGAGGPIFTLRQFQQPFIRKLDDLFIKYNNTETLPFSIRFSLVDVRSHPTLSPDRLHPNAMGYDKMAKLVLKNLRAKVQDLMRAQRTDADADGIYDQLESKFGTDNKVADTDGDGLLDGDEVFVTGTDPTLLDTDGNGTPDGQ